MIEEKHRPSFLFLFLSFGSCQEKRSKGLEGRALPFLHRSPFTVASGESTYLATSILGIEGRSMCLFCFFFVVGRSGCDKTEHRWAQTMFITSPSFFPSCYCECLQKQ
ncbi:hypothetical protein K457DRAFT_584926 [Linnemannia elongata AG-77]|uniref:Uncharacterized protein n=1 Tax=Linnemannia elongata AG-77 TaxID=1314771 RepID=A0A197KDP2_9FUNG|nr:hypothetical protein K457DRAFT_584926 [Linnemannia elongata AG-77]